MRSKRKMPTATNRQVRTRGGGTGKTGDASSRKLGKLGKKLGNHGLDDKMRGSNSRADELMAHIIERLKLIQGVQSKELQQMDHVREWYIAVAKGRPGYFIPDTTRWHEAAGLYRRAAEAISAGNLGRGSQLLERAAESERAAFESLPKQVTDQLDSSEQQAPEAPAAMGEISPNALSTQRALPDEIHVADRVLAVERRMPETPPARYRPRKLWFEEEEKEEEDEQGDD